MLYIMFHTVLTVLKRIVCRVSNRKKKRKNVNLIRFRKYTTSRGKHFSITFYNFSERHCTWLDARLGKLCRPEIEIKKLTTEIMWWKRNLHICMYICLSAICIHVFYILNWFVFLSIYLSSADLVWGVGFWRSWLKCLSVYLY